LKILNSNRVLQPPFYGELIDSNEKIAELTGFGAANTFYRNFSKKMGSCNNIQDDWRYKGR